MAYSTQKHTYRKKHSPKACLSEPFRSWMTDKSAQQPTIHQSCTFRLNYSYPIAPPRMTSPPSLGLDCSVFYSHRALLYANQPTKVQIYLRLQQAFVSQPLEQRNRCRHVSFGGAVPHAQAPGIRVSGGLGQHMQWKGAQ